MAPLEVMVDEAIAEVLPDLAPLAGVDVVYDGQLRLLAGRGSFKPF